MVLSTAGIVQQQVEWYGAVREGGRGKREEVAVRAGNMSIVFETVSAARVSLPASGFSLRFLPTASG
jgi:hypothetical protein